MSGGQAGCRSDVTGRGDLGRWAPGALFGLFVVGFWMAVVYVRQIPAADRFATAEAEFDLWVILLGAVGGCALGAAPAFLAWLVGLVRLLEDPEPATVARWLLVIRLLNGLSR